MKITKFLHSCILFETNEKVYLIDPGNFTYTQKVLPIQSLSQLDYIIVTHEHADHMYAPLIQEVLKKFPKAQIITNPSAVSKLQQEQLQAEITAPQEISVADAPHEKLWEGEVPENIVVTVENYLTHPGDSMQFDNSADILCLPITAPWGSTTQAVQKAISLKPKYIVPIHDWMWKDEARKMIYERLKEFFEKSNIKFLPLETGEAFEIS